MRLASCTAKWPVPPAAAVTNTVSLGLIWPVTCSHRRVCTRASTAQPQFVARFNSARMFHRLFSSRKSWRRNGETLYLQPHRRRHSGDGERHHLCIDRRHLVAHHGARLRMPNIEFSGLCSRQGNRASPKGVKRLDSPPT
jgi:hypothetical protein